MKILKFLKHVKQDTLDYAHLDFKQKPIVYQTDSQMGEIYRGQIGAMEVVLAEINTLGLDCQPRPIWYIAVCKHYATLWEFRRHIDDFIVKKNKVRARDLDARIMAVAQQAYGQ